MTLTQVTATPDRFAGAGKLILNSTGPGDTVYPVPVLGTKVSVMVGASLVLDTGLTAASVLSAAKGCLTPFWDLCLDDEIPRYTPDQLAGIIMPVVNSSYLVSCFAPDNFMPPGANDYPLKTLTWSPADGDPTTEMVRAYRVKNQQWLRLCWCNTYCGYFGHPIFDTMTLDFIRNTAKLSRFFDPNKPVVATISAERDDSWYPPGGTIDGTLEDRLVAVLKEENIIPRIWGLQNLNLRLIQKLVGPVQASPIGGVSGAIG